MDDKQESRRIRGEIRRVLIEVWDPIGVKDEPNAQDEYDCCLAALYEFLLTAASDETIEKYLRRTVTDHMGLNADQAAITETIKALRQIPLPRTDN
ncbi:MAG TPA: hypothetical protein VGG15_13325 [Terriglobales bacterium]|jgi:hypothetical protein